MTSISYLESLTKDRGLAAETPNALPAGATCLKYVPLLKEQITFAVHGALTK